MEVYDNYCDIYEEIEVDKKDAIACYINMLIKYFVADKITDLIFVARTKTNDDDEYSIFKGCTITDLKENTILHNVATDLLFHNNQIIPTLNDGKVKMKVRKSKQDNQEVHNNEENNNT